jgi:hypothetical protein
MITVIGFAVLIAASFFGQPAAGNLPRLEAGDLKRLTGAQWKGTLTYLDYGKNKKVSIPSNLTVTGPAADALTWTFDYQYPDEPRANSRDAVVVGGDGTIIDGGRVIERTITPEGTLKIVTEKAGPDDDKASLFRFTYLIGATTFSIKKEVRREGAADFFERNRYSWTR